MTMMNFCELLINLFPVKIARLKADQTREHHVLQLIFGQEWSTLIFNETKYNYAINVKSDFFFTFFSILIRWLDCIFFLPTSLARCAVSFSCESSRRLRLFLHLSCLSRREKEVAEEEKVVSGERKHRLKQQQNYKSNQIPCSGFYFIFTDSDSLPTTSSSES